MPANRAMVSQQSITAHEREVKNIVDGLIAKRGYHSAITVLLNVVQDLAEILSADPLSRSKEQELRMWARAVRSAIWRHSDENTFEQLVGEADAIRARGMGIRLD